MLNSSSNKRFKMPNKQKATKLPKQNPNSICQKSNHGIKSSKKGTDKEMNWLLNNHRCLIKQKHRSFLEELIARVKIFRWRNTHDLRMKRKKTLWKPTTFNLLKNLRLISELRRLLAMVLLKNNKQLTQSCNHTLQN